MDVNLQSSFFSEANDRVEEALKAIQLFEFKTGLDFLLQAQEIDPEVANAEFFRGIAIWCQNAGLNADSTAQEICELWQVVKSRMTELGGASTEMREKCKIFAHRLHSLDEFDRNGCVPQCEYFLHESACSLHMGKFQAAYDLLLDALHNEAILFPACYWGYLGDAATVLQKFTEANTAYLKLLVKNPFEIDWSTLRNKKLRSIFTEIAATESLELAYGKLPYYAWAEDAIYIPERNTFIPEELKNYTENPERIAALTPAQKAHVFALFVYAENIPPSKAVNLETREIMRDLAPELFTDYLTNQHP